MQKTQSCTLEQKLGCIDWDIWNYWNLFDYNKHGCFSELRNFLKFLWKSNRFAHHVTNLQTVLQKLVKSVTLSSQNHEKVQRFNYKTSQTQALLGALITKPQQFRRSPPMSSHKRRKFGHFSTISVILISYKQKTTILYILYIYKTQKKTNANASRFSTPITNRSVPTAWTEAHLRS